MLRIFGALGLIVFSSWLWSHPVEVCLERVADAAGRLKVCQLNQQVADECQQQRGGLGIRMAECKAALFTDQDILDAEQDGAARIKGEVSLSPYQSQLRKQNHLSLSVAPNLEAYNRFFPELSHAQSDLAEHFGGVKCPNSFEGVNDRWALAGVLRLKRFTLDASSAVDPVEFYAMEQESAGQCYPVSGDGTGHLVVNVPYYVYSGLLTDISARVLICEDSQCIGDIRALESFHQAYRLQYQEYHELLECSVIVKRNFARHRTKNQSQSALKLPDSCPAGEIDVKLKRAKSRVAESDKRLFDGGIVRLGDLKPL